MPVLAPHSPNNPSSPDIPGKTDISGVSGGSGQQLTQPVSAVLAAEFTAVPRPTVERCVADVLACAEHLGVEVTTAIIERIAREHLLAMINSAPPSSR
ncbi:hypothetical protein Aple_067630 [Acrocarpospora pleiomorpha]|uniref:Uncharacterized protein n=1 Tax=Acrocarpospora pleiomorpha TaxID=90975 RepID=A0A5M3XRK8_9ACTN|nr:hypothetical protein [Acrocarpospora pleiomorpha]GES23864.1 hypothetical protein Aple_067630 [Acrocarpospora pleiomorpha]